MKAYDYALSRSALESFHALSDSEQRLLLSAFERVASYPFSHGDVSFQDASGRDNQVLDLGGFVLTF